MQKLTSAKSALNKPVLRKNSSSTQT